MYVKYEKLIIEIPILLYLRAHWSSNLDLKRPRTITLITRSILMKTKVENETET